MKTRLVVLALVIVLFTIFVSQNTKVVPIKFLFWEFSMSAIVLISLTGLMGLIAGFIAAKIFDYKEGKIKKESENQSR